MQLDAFVTRLHDAGVGERGKTLFAYYMPETVKTGVLLRTGLAGASIDPELPGYRPDGEITMIVRASRYEAGFALTERAVQALIVESPEVLGAYQINHCRPRHEPIVYPRSSGDGLEFSVRFDVNAVRLT
jgi:hypothetical protein